ncbi:MAG: hypothetical protein C0613_09560 [Desulfobulbaceae bacterium]|nr:MAG: hypothetical protein C0613_09560 [Desulfobulbaceae bacterium]
MVGQLKFSPRECLKERWLDDGWRKPFLFSVTVHLIILTIALLPSSLFHFSRNVPEVYQVDLIDLQEAPPPPPAEVRKAPPPEPKPPPAVEQTTSSQPVLSTRTIPKAPSEIKLLRPRAMKKDIRLPPMDPSMVLGALQHIEQQQKAEEEKQRALEAIRESILTRPSAQTEAEPEQTPTADQLPGEGSAEMKRPSPGYGGAAGSGRAADTALKQYKAMVARHIGSHWSLPEGQVWHKDLRAEVIVEIRQDGIVTKKSFEKPSASAQFDKFVMQTIEEASPLPPVPQEIPLAPLRLRFYPEGMM